MRLLETKAKKRILISVLAALAALLLAAGAFYAWRAVSFAREMRALTESAGLESTAVSVREKTGLLSLRRALERQQTAHDTRAAALSDRAEEFNSSLLVLVNPWNEVPQGYTVQLDTVEGYLVDRRCARALAQMLADCRAAGYEPIICSAYRTQEYQEMLYRNKILRLLAEGVPNADAPTIAAQSVALPGTSEHQLGLALDLISETYTNLDQWQERTEVQQWLMQNCWRYGFILRYPNGTSETTGIIYEPWHYRYVGSETAKAVTESGLVFEDYLKTLESE